MQIKAIEAKRRGTASSVLMKAGMLLVLSCTLSFCPAEAAPDPVGRQMFLDNCSACHQPEGKGVPGAFPALAGDKFVVGPEDPVISTVLNGRGGMPTFKTDLTNDQIAHILSYVRQSWGNKAPAVTAQKVAKLRNGPQPAKSKPLQAH